MFTRSPVSQFISATIGCRAEEPKSIHHVTLSASTGISQIKQHNCRAVFTSIPDIASESPHCLDGGQELLLRMQSRALGR